MTVGENYGSVKRPKISIFLPDLRPGGAEVVHVALAKAWVEYGADVEFVVMQKHGELLTTIPQYIQVVELGVHRIRGTILPLMRYLRERKPDVLVSAMWPLTFTAVLALKISMTRTLCVLSEHTMLSEAYRSKGAIHNLFMKLTSALAYRAADVVVAVSKAVAEDLAAVSGLAEDRFNIIYNPAARGEGNESWTAKDFRPSTATVLTVGSLKKSKNHLLLVRAFKILSATVDVQLVIVGEGDMREGIEQLVSQLGLTDKVFMPGFSEDPYAYYRRSDLFVLSADYEGFGNVLVEALECGLPVVSTDCKGGPREILDNGRYGELVPMRDASALANAMKKMLQTPPPPHRQNSRAQLFTVDKAASAYYELFGLNSKAGDDINNPRNSHV